MKHSLRKLCERLSSIRELHPLYDIIGRISSASHQEKQRSNPHLDMFSYIHGCLKVFTNNQLYAKDRKSKEYELLLRNVEISFHSVIVYFDLLEKIRNKRGAKKMLDILFMMSFKVDQSRLDNTYKANILTTFCYSDVLMTEMKRYIYFEGPPGSGKTLCSILIFILRSLYEGKNLPKIILVQPNVSLIPVRVKEIRSILGDMAMIKRKASNFKKLKVDTEHYAIGVFSPMEVIKYLQYAKEDEKHFTETRFILDDINQRSVDTDLMVASLIDICKDREVKKAQIVLLSSSPDQYVIKAFKKCSIIDNKFNMHIFKVIKQKIVIENSRLLEETISSQIFKELNTMSTERRTNGSILCCLSDRKQYNRIIHSLINKNRKKRTRIRYITDINCFELDVKSFRNLIKKKVTNNNNCLFVLPLDYSQSFDEKQYEVLNTNYSIIKLVFVTPSTEQIIKIDDLFCVVDTGIYTHIVYDHINGIPVQIESPISQQIAEQRKNRLKNYPHGKYLSIRISGSEYSDKILPEIDSIDLTTLILNYRKKGIVFEQMKHLPQPINQEKLDFIIQELRDNNLLKNDNSLTNLGDKICIIECLPPFLSVSMFEFYNKMNQSAFYGIMAAEILLIMLLDEKFFYNINSPVLQENFNMDSDIITVFRSINSALKLTKLEFEERIQSFGFNKSLFENFLSNLHSFFEIFNIERGINSDDESNDESDDGGGSDSFSSFKEYLAFVESQDILQCVNTVISIIQLKKPQWIKLRNVEFSHVEINQQMVEVFYQKGSDIPENGFKTEIIIRQRPGWKGLMIPGKIQIFSILKQPNSNQYSGFLVHKDYTKEIYGVISKKISLTLNNDYLVPMLKGYIGYDNSNQNMIDILYQDKRMRKHEKFSIYSKSSEYYLVFCPRNQPILNSIEIGLPLIERIMPFVPRSLLMINEDPECFIEMFNNGSSSYETKIHFNDKTPKAYRVNSSSIDFAYQNYEKLLNAKMEIRFALTGTVFSLNSGLSENSIYEICTDPSFIRVFDQSPSHLVLLCDLDIPQIPSGKLLKWEYEPLNIKEPPISIIDKIPQKPFIANIRDAYVALFSQTLVNGSTFINELDNKAKQSKTIVQTQLKVWDPLKVSIDCSLKENVEKRLKIELESQKVSISFLNGNIGCIVNDKFFMNRDQRIEKSIFSSFSESNSKIEYVEKISLITFKITNYPRYKFDNKRFLQIIKNIANQYQQLITNYNESLPDSQFKYVDIEMIYCDFSINFASDLSKVFSSYVEFEIIIPKEIIHPSLLSFKVTSDLFKKRFLSDYRVRIYHSKLYVSLEDKDQIQGIIFANNFKFECKYEVINLGKKPINQYNRLIQKFIKEKGQESAYFDFFNRAVVVKKRYLEEVQDILSVDPIQTSQLFGCVNCCDEPIVSSSHIVLLNQDKSTDNMKVCLDCMASTLEYSLIEIMDNDSIILDKLYKSIPRLPTIIVLDPIPFNDVFFPQFPFVQLLWILIKEKKCHKLIKYWINAVKIQTLCLTKNYFTCCPTHPNKFFKLPPRDKDLKCPVLGCANIYCHECRTWHIPGAKDCKERIWKGPKCPNCYAPTIKESGCNHISCICGCHWCYVCGKGYTTSTECYSHLKELHGTYYSEVQHTFY